MRTFKGYKGPYQLPQSLLPFSKKTIFVLLVRVCCCVLGLYPRASRRNRHEMNLQPQDTLRRFLSIQTILIQLRSVIAIKPWLQKHSWAEGCSKHVHRQNKVITAGGKCYGAKQCRESTVHDRAFLFFHPVSSISSNVVNIHFLVLSWSVNLNIPTKCKLDSLRWVFYAWTGTTWVISVAHSH